MPKMPSAKRYYWFPIAAAALVVAFAPFPLESHSSPHTLHAFSIEAHQFAYSPSVLAVEPGDTVTITLSSSDVVHGLYLDGYGLSIQADPGQAASLTFVADRPGSFRFRCNVTCDAMHPFMIGRLNVGSDDTFLRGIALATVGLIGLVFAPPHSASAATEA